MTGLLPSHARIVVIGGGVVGASVAYHLAAAGCRETVLVERAKIGSGTSWHAAGNMETYRADPLIGEMIGYAVELYPRLEAETGQALGWRQTGRVMFTASPERMAQYRGLPALGRARGIDIALLSPGEVVDRLPIASPAGLAGGVWIPSDGRINPTDLATAFARGARMKGAAILEDCPVTGMTVENGRVTGVVTPEGETR
jgi:4-methylaminobutanoate oxidase (formaldehyde-forming)